MRARTAATAALAPGADTSTLGHQFVPGGRERGQFLTPHTRPDQIKRNPCLEYCEDDFLKVGIVSQIMHGPRGRLEGGALLPVGLN